MTWDITEAQEKFTDLLTASHQEPQLIYNEQGLVAAVIQGDVWQQFIIWKRQQQTRTIADAFAELRQICQDENFTLEIPERQDRNNTFLEENEDVM